MALNNIQLPAGILQLLYSSALYDFTNNALSIETNSPTTLSYLGDNLKNIVIVVENNDELYLPETELNFLLSILSACQLTMADIALLNISHNKNCTYLDIFENFGAKIIMLFATNAQHIGLPLQFPHYQVQQFNNQTYLSSDGLLKLQSDKNEKIKLWNCLKKIFSV